MKFTFRKISPTDYKSYLELVEIEDITLDRFIEWINLEENHIYVVMYKDKMIATITLVIRQNIKGIYSEISDLYIQNGYRENKILEKLLDLCIYKSHKKRSQYILYKSSKELDLSKSGFYVAEKYVYKLDFYEK